MFTVESLEGAACVGHDPNLWDLDAHHHVRLGKYNDCWMCDEAGDICVTCPVFAECAAQAVKFKDSACIRAARAWSSGRPRSLVRRRT